MRERIAVQEKKRRPIAAVTQPDPRAARLDVDQLEILEQGWLPPARALPTVTPAASSRSFCFRQGRLSQGRECVPPENPLYSSPNGPVLGRLIACRADMSS